jgi:excisionase family DNA binding protein
MITTTEAAAILQVSRRRVEALINAKRLPAEKIGRDWLIRPEDLELVKVRRPGRPPRPV